MVAVRFHGNIDRRPSETNEANNVHLCPLWPLQTTNGA